MKIEFDTIVCTKFEYLKQIFDWLILVLLSKHGDIHMQVVTSITP